jgi:hypothetical protein
VGANSQLILDDAQLCTDTFFNVVQGNMLVRNEVTFSGMNTKIAWTSPGTCTVDAFSRLTFDFGTTFSYDSAARNRNKFVMTDYSSWLYLNNATFHVTRPGLTLSGGSVYLKNAVVFSSEAQIPAEALLFDSLLKVYVPLGASLEPRGIVMYQ